MGQMLRVGMREVNSFPGEEARRALGKVETSTLKRLSSKGRTSVHREAERGFLRPGQTGMRGSLGNPDLL